MQEEDRITRCTMYQSSMLGFTHTKGGWDAASASPKSLLVEADSGAGAAALEQQYVDQLRYVQYVEELLSQTRSIAPPPQDFLSRSPRLQDQMTKSSSVPMRNIHSEVNYRSSSSRETLSIDRAEAIHRQTV